MRNYIFFIFCLLFYSICPASEPTHIYGIHDWGFGANGLFNGKTRWDVEVVRVGIDSVNNIQQIKNEGFELIIRLAKNWGESVPINSGEWDSFAASCASTVSVYTAYSKRFIIGNEMNANFDSNIPASSYVTIYTKCRNAIKAVAPDVEVVVAAVAPQNSSQNPGGPLTHAWLNYFYAIVTSLGNNCDAYAIHAYGGRNGDADPRDDNYFSFGVYTSWMKILEADFYGRTKPVYLTEMNCFINGQSSTPGYPLYPYSSGWINKAYEAIDNWNRNNIQKIWCACWFAYSNGGFPGYDLTLIPQASSDFSNTTQNTNYKIQDPLFIPPTQWQFIE